MIKTSKPLCNKKDVNEMLLFCPLENNCGGVYRDSKQSHDDAHHRPSFLSTEVCFAEDEATRCKCFLI